MRLPSDEPPADKIALLEQFDGFAPLRNGLRKIAAEREDWAGIPMPLEHERLVIEPRYPMGKELSAIGAPPEPLPDDATIRNVFHSGKTGCDIVIFEKGGKIDWGQIPKVNHFAMDLHTLGCSLAWGIEQESRAVQLLGTLIRHHAFKQYLLTGMFMETSKRSGLTYVFRKLRPTVVIDIRNHNQDSTRILCALCMHPIAYYQDTWAGAMCPTDDVIAHLMLMRGDEHMYWRRCNQHAPYRPEAGL